FRVMKTNFSVRPIHHRNRERIIAHFMICYTALLIYRLLEAKLDDYGTHFTTENIIETLKNMEVVNVQDMYYLSTYNGSRVCTALNAVFDLALDKKYYQPKELNKKIKKIFCFILKNSALYSALNKTIINLNGLIVAKVYCHFY
ncbi:MAG: hypothetical protein K6T54_02275, partial [Ignavibacterium sp.]|nr:hypothetical protein [Ignavibacterium sp.]